MSNSDSRNPASQGAAGANNAAVEYVQNQLQQARVSLKRIQIIGVILVLLITCSMTYLVTRWKAELDPKTAAKTAVDQLSAQVIEHATQLSDQLKEKAPQFIAGLPDIVLRELPEQRETLEKHVTAELLDYLHNSSKVIDKHLDHFFEEQKADILAVLKAADDKEALHALGVDLQNEIISFLAEKPASGESIQEKIDKALEMLKHVETRMERLAKGADLTSAEKKARRAIALITHKLDKQIDKAPVN